MDDRRVNAFTVNDKYPHPKMDEFLDSLGDAIFSLRLWNVTVGIGKYPWHRNIVRRRLLLIILDASSFVGFFLVSVMRLRHSRES